MVEFYVFTVVYHQMLELLIKFELYKDVKKFHTKVPSVVRFLQSYKIILLKIAINNNKLIY